jgi:hypothetical protein
VPDVPDSQGATLSFDGTVLGILRGVSPSFSAGNIHEVTSMRSPVLGAGQNARVLKQFNCTSVDTGSVTARFIGLPGFSRNDIGGPGTLTLTWPSGGTLSAAAVLEQLDAELTTGELVQWVARFKFTGF